MLTAKLDKITEEEEDVADFSICKTFECDKEDDLVYHKMLELKKCLLTCT